MFVVVRPQRWYFSRAKKTQRGRWVGVLDVDGQKGSFHAKNRLPIIIRAVFSSDVFWDTLAWNPYGTALALVTFFSRQTIWKVSWNNSIALAGVAFFGGKTACNRHGATLAVLF